ncbi:MAG: isoprenyl transferase [Bacteroides sp.]|nr:MAG: isoprenyl transferase [Bacteroides sp.]
MNKKNNIIIDKLPKHIAIIMDGNGRWGKINGTSRIDGHKKGIESVKDIINVNLNLGIGYLTLYVFSNENWKRPSSEVSALIHLLVNTVKSEKESLMKNNIKLNVIGKLEKLPKYCYKALYEVMNVTKKNNKMLLNLAISYSSQLEIIDMVHKVIKMTLSKSINVNSIDKKFIKSLLYTANIPDPELIIRTGGEKRISNFMLWQIAYSELYFTEKLWPDFKKEDYYEAIIDYQNRERRFGLISEQI